MFNLPNQIKVIASGFFLALCPPIAACAEPVIDAVRSIERDLGARVGFYMHDTQTGEVITYAADDHFPLNSTFKLLACGALLSQVENGEARLADTVSLQDVEFVDYSPALEAHRQAGNWEVSLGAACGMMLSVSDNTAANIVLSALGGPGALTSYLRSIGDQATRLDRWETALNTAVPGDPRDTTTPRAIAQSAQDLIIGNALQPASQATLRAWLEDHRVADGLFRSALPSAWSIDDRTGAGGYGSRSIVAVIYPPERAPIIVSLFMTETEASFARKNAAAARVGAAIVGHVAQQ
ncbi:class A beta-lactamase [Tropicibacter sp. R16_0]|uniref:class A beta-lactamase n=1 Tax=Tropicibacter sp. R16_0 TaxID=2821102 RepID=UPI001ADC8904|nr:class A beta-lactamase [Tropicibacter sp. R16_0]MBO9453029.1 class A beta-lactamase [Tropicibacter sp. R16_0]